MVDADRLPKEWAAWNSPEGWVVGTMWYDEHEMAYVFSRRGTGSSIESALIDARTQDALVDERVRKHLAELQFGVEIGRPPATASEHLEAARVIVGAIR